MDEYENLGHMMSVSTARNSQARLCYLPHHGVLKRTDDTVKLRVVFNGSTRLISGESLNQHLLTGPNLLPSLLDVLLRWRMHEFAMVADIEKMYRQILVHPEDRDLQRIVWRRQDSADLQELRLNTVTYGLACAPFLAIRTLKQLTDDEGHRHPRRAEVLRRDVFVDDVLTGAATLTEARTIQAQLNALCTAGGFPLRKWSANRSALLTDIPIEHQQPLTAHTWETDAGHSTLGLLWHPKTDAFAFRVRPTEIGQVTKRTVLSQTARLFDPLGWLAPVTISEKILIQSTWIQKLEWDEPVTGEDERRWRQFQEELPVLDQIRVPRWIRTGPTTGQIEIHGFADASKRAYAAVVYLRTIEEGAIRVSLLVDKSKVAPIHQVSLPRLELCAAVLLTNLVHHVRAVTSLADTRTVLWSDSTVALAWIHGHPSRWTTFVANRVAQTQRELPDVQWQHIAGVDNPADCASKGVTPMELLEHNLWWHGSSWLTKHTWDRRSVPLNHPDIPEQRTRAHAATTGPSEDETLRRFSSLHRFLCVTAWCRRWLGEVHSRRSGSVLGISLTAQELEAGQLCWILKTQATWYERELKLITAGRPVPCNSQLVNLSLYADELGILRVGGRLKHSVLSHDKKHLIILPRAHIPLHSIDSGRKPSSNASRRCTADSGIP